MLTLVAPGSAPRVSRRAEAQRSESPAQEHARRRCRAHTAPTRARASPAPSSAAQALDNANGAAKRSCAQKREEVGGLKGTAPHQHSSTHIWTNIINTDQAPGANICATCPKKAPHELPANFLFFWLCCVVFSHYVPRTHCRSPAVPFARLLAMNVFECRGGN